MKLLNVLNTGRVLRYHSAPIHRKQNLATHQWEVAIILEHIWPKCSKELLLMALTHDCAESFTGDLPAPVKAQHPEIKKLLKELELQGEIELGIQFGEFTDKERLAVKHADILSGMWFTHQQIRAGDRDARCIAQKWYSFYQELAPLNHTSRQLVMEIENYECKR